MRLVVDIGNTRSKLALFHNGVMTQNSTMEKADPASVEKFVGNNTIDAAIISSVTETGKELAGELQHRFPCLFLDDTTALPVTNLYATKKTLGPDRLAAAIGGWQLFGQGPVLTIMAGTCITYNVINDRNEFTGGAISPGLMMRARAMHEFTSKLPLVPLKDVIELTGNDTVSSMQSGILNGAVSEIKGMTESFAAEYPGIRTVLGGGDSGILAKAMKNGIFARPDIQMEGLHSILDLNVKNNLL